MKSLVVILLACLLVFSCGSPDEELASLEQFADIPNQFGYSVAVLRWAMPPSTVMRVAIGDPDGVCVVGGSTVYHCGTVYIATYDYINLKFSKLQEIKAPSADQATGLRFGQTLASTNCPLTKFNACDVGDTVSLAIGAPGYSSSKGKVYFYASPLASPPTPSWTSVGDNQTGAQFGAALSYICTTDEDTEDIGLLVSAPYYDGGGYTDSGKVYLYEANYTSTCFPSTPLWTSVGGSYVQSNARFGWSLARVDIVFSPPVSCLYCDSIMVGTPYYHNGSTTDAGMTSIFHAHDGSLPSTNPDWVSTGSSANELFGWSVAAGTLTLGDTNGDWDDILIGAPGYNPGSYVNRGQACLHLNTSGTIGVKTCFGPKTQIGTSDNEANMKFGYSVSIPRGDGGAPKYRAWVSAPFRLSLSGRVYVHKGTTGGYNTTPQQVFTGDSGRQLGMNLTDVQRRSNIDMDDYDDMLVGESGNGGTFGWVKYYFGSSDSFSLGGSFSHDFL